jgi:hypothetical protein
MQSGVFSFNLVTIQQQSSCKMQEKWQLWPTQMLKNTVPNTLIKPIHWAEPFLSNWPLSWSRNSSPFMETQGLHG